MSRTVEDASARFLALLAGALGFGLLAASPTVVAGPAGSGVAVLSLALAALLAIATRHLFLAVGLRPVVAVVTSGPPPTLSGRAADPVHHPLRPRAPGLT
jgi:hypothetical protein